jgi:sugar phosphate permease
MKRVSPRVLVPVGLLIAAAGMALLARIGMHSSYVSTILPSLLVAIRLGFVFAPSFSLGTLGVAGSDAGVASATINVSQQIGGSIGTALLNSIATSAAATFMTTHATGRPSAALVAQASVHSYTVAFWVGAAIFAVAALVIFPVLRPGVPDLSANEEMEAVVVHA